jgi:rhamnosyltransferase
MTLTTMDKLPKVAAIITTYLPGAGFRERIASVVNHCDYTIVVDNTPAGCSFSADESRDLIILQDGVNKGLGRALNQGIAAAKARGCRAVVLFDQDSSPPAEFIRSLIEGLDAAGPNSVVGPKLTDDALVGLRPPASSQGLPVEVTCLATSGMAFRIDGLTDEDGFAQDFFLDFVDFDWCWRMRAQGWRLYRLEALEMPHRLGLAQRQWMGLTYHVPAPYRHYFQFRDTLRLVMRPYVPAYSRIRLGLILLPKFFVYPFILDRGRERLGWMLTGIRDAFRSVSGAGAASELLLCAPTKSF